MVWGSGTPRIVDAHMQNYSEADRAKVKAESAPPAQLVILF
jgi:hypothetical protein